MQFHSFYILTSLLALVYSDVMYCRNDKFKVAYAKNDTRTPDNVQTRILVKNTHAGLKKFLKAF